MRKLQTATKLENRINILKDSFYTDSKYMIFSYLLNSNEGRPCGVGELIKAALRPAGMGRLAAFESVIKRKIIQRSLSGQQRTLNARLSCN